MLAKILTLMLPITILVSILLPMVISKQKVHWEPSVNLFEDGKDARLICSGTECEKNVPKVWRGGIPYNVLCSDLRSPKPEKYLWRPLQGGSSFELYIKNVSLMDLKCNYTCNCGFEEFTSVIPLDSYYHRPDTDPIRTSSTKYEDYILIDVNISKAYPLPTCMQYLVYEGKAVEEELKINGKTDDDGLFVNLNVRSKLDCKDYKSEIQSNILCDVKQQKFKVFSASLNCAIDSKAPTTITVIVVAVISGVLLIFLLLIIWKRRRMEPSIRNQAQTFRKDREKNGIHYHAKEECTDSIELMQI